MEDDKKFPSSRMTGSEGQKLLLALEMIYDRLGEVLDELKHSKEFNRWETISNK